MLGLLVAGVTVVEVKLVVMLQFEEEVVLRMPVALVPVVVAVVKIAAAAYAQLDLRKMSFAERVRN